MLAKIIPNPSDSRAANETQGTRVMVGDAELTGVVKIELTAEPNSLWRAVIHCHVIPPELVADAELVQAEHNG